MVGTNVQRAVKDLSAYVSLHPNDEEAVNRLGAAGRKAMDSMQHFENTQLCQDSERVLASARGAVGEHAAGASQMGHELVEGFGIQLDRV